MVLLAIFPRIMPEAKLGAEAVLPENLLYLLDKVEKGDVSCRMKAGRYLGYIAGFFPGVQAAVNFWESIVEDSGFEGVDEVGWQFYDHTVSVLLVVGQDVINRGKLSYESREWTFLSKLVNNRLGCQYQRDCALGFIIGSFERMGFLTNDLSQALVRKDVEWLMKNQSCGNM